MTKSGGRFGACLLLLAAGLAGCDTSDRALVTEPDPVELPPGFTHVTTGYHHSCVLDGQGEAYCWGHNVNRGQLGDGTYVDSSIPVRVLGSIRFRELAGGAHHTCGLTAAGFVYCWGKNDFGQLGNGTFEDTPIPMPVTGGHRFATVVAGASHTCGLTFEGEAYCWGTNGRGQLGDGGTETATEPVAVVGGLRFELLAAGFDHACGIVAGGQAYCWGKNSEGQLGDGTLTYRNAPVPVGGDLRFLESGAGRIAGGQNHTCAITVDRQLYCWGDNWHNQLGLSSTRSVVRLPQAVAGMLPVDQVAAGGDHTCVTDAEGIAWCWGDSKRGQLGVEGELTDYNPPAPVAGGHSFTSLSLGWDHTCGIVTAGDVYCWGYNGFGQLGIGEGGNRRYPMQVIFPETDSPEVASPDIAVAGAQTTAVSTRPPRALPSSTSL